MNTGLHHKRFLVVGGQSQIGTALNRFLSQAGAYVPTTSRRREAPSDLFLDLTSEPDEWTLPEDVQAAFICAGVTSLDKCRRYPAATREINVAKTVLLANRLVERGVFTIFLSSNWVFDGFRPCAPADGPASPCIEYGRQKREAEERLADIFHKLAVVRLTKVIDRGTPLLGAWRQKLLAGLAIEPFSDFMTAPLSIGFTARVLTAIACLEQGGVWQVSAKEDISYERIGRYLAESLETSSELVQPITTAESDVCFEHVPRFTSLDTKRLDEQLGLNAPSPWEAIDYFLTNRGNP